MVNTQINTWFAHEMQHLFQTWLLNSTTGLDWGFCSGGISDLVYVEDFTVISGTMAHTAEYIMSHKQILLLDF